MNDQKIISYVATIRRTAKFIKCAHSSTFISADLGFSFYHVLLYDEDISSTWISSEHNGFILIENSYLTSFSHNLLLAWIAPNVLSTDAGNVSIRTQLMKYNFKKFFGEQLLHFKNCIFARSIFLETLLFEEKAMASYLEAARQSKDANALMSQFATIISSIIRTHELNHYFIKLSSNEWAQLAGEHESIASTVEAIRNDLDENLFDEIRCDVIAVLRTYQECASDEDKSLCLQMIVFGFATFSVMASLEWSAKSTIQEYCAIPDTVDLQSIERVGGIYDYVNKIDDRFRCRTEIVQAVCEKIAQEEGLILYSIDGPLVFGKSIIEEFFEYMSVMTENEDQNASKMSHLVATALHDHPKGIEFLYMHSKVFRSVASQNL